MGVVIYTNNADKYKVGTFIEMHGHLSHPPTTEGITYIVYGWKPDDPDWWAERISYRLVCVLRRKPTVKGESIIIDWEEKKENYNTAIGAAIKWADRDRVRHMIRGVPIPLILSWLKANNNSIGFWRMLSKANMHLPDEYTEAIIAYGLRGRRGRLKYPTKTKQIDSPIEGFRSTDKYSVEIMKGDVDVANEMRDKHKDALPKQLKKTKESVPRWF